MSPALTIVRAAFLVGVIALGSATSVGPDAPQPAAAKPFAKGVRLDWARHQVEVDAVVVFRDGPLELLACSPNTREHESILRVPARPRDIYHAMGLIGLEPGRPLRVHPADGRILPPRGERLRIQARYREGPTERIDNVANWLLDSQRLGPPRTLDWVFAGAATLPDGAFTADLEGTIICVVDFETALIALGSLHSADNDQLWLRANTAAIPPVGTRVTLLIGSAEPRSITVRVDRAGTMHLDGRQVSPAAVVRAAHEAAVDKPSPRVILQVSSSLPDDALRPLVDSLIKAGLPEETVAVRREAGSPPGTAPATPGA